jgi:hypothetical protein
MKGNGKLSTCITSPNNQQKVVRLHVAGVVVCVCGVRGGSFFPFLGQIFGLQPAK